MKNDYDLIIIGGGPAGITASIYASRANLKVLMIEEKTMGGKLVNINTIENYPGFNMISGVDLANNLLTQFNNYNVDILNDKVISINDKNVILLANNGEQKTKAILIATGSKLKKLDIPYADEFEGNGISYCATCDGFFFKNKKVVVIGDNNQALQESLYLSNLVSKLSIITNKNYLDADSSLIEQISKNDNIDFFYNTVPIELIINNNLIKGIVIKDITNNQKTTIEASGIFPYISYNPSTDFINKKILNEEGFVIVNNDMSTKIDGIFAAGDCVNKQLKQIVTACADGAIAATSIIRYLKNQKL